MHHLRHGRKLRLALPPSLPFDTKRNHVLSVAFMLKAVIWSNKDVLDLETLVFALIQLRATCTRGALISKLLARCSQCPVNLNGYL